MKGAHDVAGNRTLGIKVFRAWPAGQRKQKVPFDMDSIEGINLLDLFSDMNDALEADPLKDHEKQVSIRVAEQTATDYTHLVTYRRGVYGDAGREVVDEDSGLVTHPLTERESVPETLRCALVVPPGVNDALLFTEHDGSTSVATSITDELKAAFGSQDVKTLVEGRKKGEVVERGVTLNVTTHQDKEAWRQGARLLRFRVIRRQREADFTPQGSNKKVTASMSESELYLPAGSKGFADWISQALFGNAIDAATHLALDEPDEVEGIEVTREKDGKTRTYMLGTERTPVFRRVLSSAGLPAIDDHAFMDAVKGEAEHYFDKIGVQLSRDWLDLEEFQAG